jgi:fido (protein-threonine AMPylation protein)
VAGPAWDDEVSSVRADENLTNVRIRIISASRASRSTPTDEMVRGWHREMVDGIDIPDDAYRGGFRGDPHPALADYEVTVGKLFATRASDVASEVSKLISELQARVTDLDDLDAQGDPSTLDAAFVENVLDTAALLHGEWIKIHPFVNGNGRTARMWVLWLCSRYGLPQLLPLRPRPDMGYGPASLLSMTGDHGLFLQYLLVRFNSL